MMVELVDGEADNTPYKFHGKPYNPPPLLPPIANGKEKTIVLDMDNTLINATTVTPAHYDFVIDLKTVEYPCTPLYVQKRPAVDTLFKTLRKYNYEVVIFTAACDYYAIPILNALDSRNVITHRLYADSCTPSPHGAIKDLDKLGRDFSDVFIVDDNPTSYLKHPRNAFPVKDFRGDLADRDLVSVIEFCKIAAKFRDVREALRLNADVMKVSSVLSTFNSCKFKEREREKLFRPKRTIVLDMDNTLIKTSLDPLPRFDFIISLPDMYGFFIPCYVMKRPGLDKFLSEIAKDYEIVVFTETCEWYANVILDKIDVGFCIKRRLYRRACVAVNGELVKDLRVLDRDLSGVVVIDDNPASCAFQPENAIVVAPFDGEPWDMELFRVRDFCKAALMYDDVRKAIATLKRRWGMAGENESIRNNKSTPCTIL